MADENAEISRFSLLPEGCVAIIISFTSPKDACTAAAVSLGFKSAAESDTVWERFLPPDYREIVDGSDSPVAFSTKKELYFLLCDSPLLLDGGKMSFRLCRLTGNKCYMLSARQLQIAWGDNHMYWTWTSSPDSRFTEVAELQSVCWLDIRATFEGQMLSPNTTYAAYLVFKLSEDHYGLDCSSKAAVQLVWENGGEVEGGEPTTIYVVPPTRRPYSFRSRLSSGRSDGWLEIKLGQFFIGEGHQCRVQIQVSETEWLNWKRGLIVQGMELRPKEAF